MPKVFEDKIFLDFFDNRASENIHYYSYTVFFKKKFAEVLSDIRSPKTFLK